jgi:phosphohistidine phosphatase
MKMLLLVRHAQAAPATPRMPDHDRPLDPRGLRDAATVGRLLAARGTRLDAIVVSPALRALTTARLIATELGYGDEAIAIEPRLYSTSAEQVLGILRALDGGHGTVMLCGHNPEFAELVHQLSGTAAGMPPGTLATLYYDIAAWAEVGTVRPSAAKLDVPGRVP